MDALKFREFASSKKIVREDIAIKELYDNNYKTYRESVRFIYGEMRAYDDVYYYYDSKKDIIIKKIDYIGD